MCVHLVVHTLSIKHQETWLFVPLTHTASANKKTDAVVQHTFTHHHLLPTNCCPPLLYPNPALTLPTQLDSHASRASFSSTQLPKVPPSQSSCPDLSAACDLYPTGPGPKLICTHMRERIDATGLAITEEPLDFPEVLVEVTAATLSWVPAISDCWSAPFQSLLQQ